jgi:hypothetical protein
MRTVASIFLALTVLIVVAVLPLPVAGPPSVAHAQDDFFSSSPGPLSASHAELDTRDKCNDCHTGGRELSNEKCLACHDHDDLKAQIDKGEGFHSSSVVKGKKCESCHGEHKGRTFDIMGWRSVQGGQQKFDHKLTGWPLAGKHAAIECTDCHKNKNKQGLRTFIGEERLCGACHKKDQPHGFERREMLACERCHGESVWKPALTKLQFDHNDPKDAKMALIGSHADVSCAKCHPKALFDLKPPDPENCAHCHKSPHDGQLFGTKKCDSCHSPKFKTLQKMSFDHDRKTKFVLGGHSKLDCYQCHTKKLGERKPSASCAPCHAADNKHKDRFDAFGSPPKCELCHPTTAWKPPIFDHDKRTQFDLTGAHAEAQCRDCHRGKNPADFERFNVKTVGCMGCHKHKDVHDKEFKDNQCLGCHKGAGRVEITNKSVDIYHGPKSRFPLVLAHAKVKCEQCHLNNKYENTPMECGVRCHEDSLHRGELGDTCSKCHSGGTWKATLFDHTADTTWPLLGLHKTEAKCAGCHPTRKYDKTPTTCGSAGCHLEDDAHKGALGNQCEKCHKETGENFFNHNTMSRFKLDGQHLTTRCAECHTSVTFKPRPTNCFGCHAEPAIHKGQYGTLCETCHTTKTWVDIRALHDVGDFALTGAHDNLPCQRCHKDNRPLAGSGNLCLNCHRQDDIHSNSLSPRCGECHTQWSFAPARFDHTTVGCNLTGLHRTLTCYGCHKTGSFGGLNPTCYGCHHDDGVQVGTRANSDIDHAVQVTCGGCHKTDTWVPGMVGTGFGSESICQ